MNEQSEFSEFTRKLGTIVCCSQPEIKNIEYMKDEKLNVKLIILFMSYVLFSHHFCVTDFQVHLVLVCVFYVTL